MFSHHVRFKMCAPQILQTERAKTLSLASALRSKLVGLLVVLKMKIMRIIIYCVYWEKADENPVDQESWKNLICERSVRIRSLTASVRLKG